MRSLIELNLYGPNMHMCSWIWPWGFTKPETCSLLKSEDLITGVSVTSTTKEKTDTLKEKIWIANRLPSFIKFSYMQIEGTPIDNDPHPLPIQRLLRPPICPSKEVKSWSADFFNAVFISLYKQALREGKKPPYILFSGPYNGWALLELPPFLKERSLALQELILNISDEASVDDLFLICSDFLKQENVDPLTFRSLCLYLEKEVENLSSFEAETRLHKMLGDTIFLEPGFTSPLPLTPGSSEKSTKTSSLSLSFSDRSLSYPEILKMERI